MTIPRRELVDVEVTRYYHCISRCVRRAFLCGDGFEHRKQWIEDRLKLLAANFAISTGGFTVMDNHLHLLLRLDPDDAKSWSPKEVIRRWFNIFPPTSSRRGGGKSERSRIREQLRDSERVEVLRSRLSDLGWFMKSLKEPLARMANREDGCRGTFWEGRYKSIAILDEEALLATCAYIDLNPVAAGIAVTPQESRHTSIRSRIDHLKLEGLFDWIDFVHGQTTDKQVRRAEQLEQSHWLCPLIDQRSSGATREGMFQGCTFRNYLQLLDSTSRMIRPGHCSIDRDEESTPVRSAAPQNRWSRYVSRLFDRDRLRGSFFATKSAALEHVAERLGRQRIFNVAGRISETERD